MRNLTFVLAISLATSACVQAADELDVVSAPILGGTAGTVGQYPTVVGILNAGICTGTLVGPDLVLTAAHCISPSVLGYSNQAQVTANTTVVLDTTFVYGSEGRTIAAAETIPNPGFSVNALGDDDIGLIRLAENVTDRTPTPINRVNADAPAGIAVDMVGYGMTDPENQMSAGRLFVLLGKVSRSCQSWEGTNANLLCFDQTNATGKCSGDSGGPSFAKIDGVTKVVGVTSFGDQFCQQFGADTRVDAELSFLDANAPELQCQADGVCVEECGTGTMPIDPDCPVCDIDDDCESDDDECIGGQCVAKPNTPGGIGWECIEGDECDSDICATGPGGQFCTEICDPVAVEAECPSDFDCMPVGDTGACWPAEDDGGGCCRVGGGAPTGDAALVLLVIGLFVVTRRRRS